MPDEQRFLIDFQPVGRRVEIPAGETILDASRSAGVGLISLCGGEGWCDSCQVRIVRGKVNPPTQSEVDSLGKDRIAAGFRLACQAVPLSDVRIDIPSESLSTPQRLQVEGKDFEIAVSPAVSAVDLQLSAPSLDDLRADGERLLAALQEKGHQASSLGLPVLEILSDRIREYGWTARVILRDGEVISILPSGTDIFGIAVDIGTTKIAVYLVNLQNGEIAGKVGVMNPQIAYGEDIISRISFLRDHPQGRAELQQTIADALNLKIDELCLLAALTKDQLVDAVIVGNTAMHHLFAGLPVSQLVFAPYVPALNQPVDIRARDLGLVLAPGACVHLLPNIAGYVGADHAAVILSTELWKTQDTVLAVDIGTNTEISLVHNGRISSCSCASGPAFEGAHITHGMRAAPGAIEKVQLVKDEIKLYTIEDQIPVGICGSGILDVVAVMKGAGLMDEKGAIYLDTPLTRLNEKGFTELVLVPAAKTDHGQDITVSRKDINEIQLAKAAIRSGMEILLREAGIRAGDIDRVLVAGAFGTYLSIPNALAIGMFPDIPIERFQQVGNAAGMGAVQALISAPHRKLIKEVIQKVTYLELTTYGDFQKIYLDSMYFR